MGYFHRFLIFGLLAELLTIKKSKNISGHFLLFFAFIPPGDEGEGIEGNLYISKESTT
jgi:hypothetical protein